MGKKNISTSSIAEIENEERIDLIEVLFRILRNWYWFGLSTVLTVALAVLYIIYATPIYEVNASVIIQDQSSSSSSMMSSGGGGAAAAAAGSMVGMDIGGLFSSANNFENELQILQSRTTIVTTIEELDLYITHSFKRGISKDELYKTSPINVWMSSDDAFNLESVAELQFTKLSDDNFQLDVKIGDSLYAKRINKFPSLLPTSFGTFTISMGDSLTYSEWGEKDKLLVEVNDPHVVADAYMEQLSISQSTKTTTIADVSLRTAVRERGIDFINRLVEIYNRDVNEAKNIQSSKSAHFIEERIAIINNELTITEQRLENFKRRAGITDLDSEAKLALAENTEYNRQSVENSMHLQMVTYLKEYVLDPKNKYDLLPVNVAMTNLVLMELIVSYNEMVFERNMMLRTSYESSPSVSNITVALDALRESVISAIKSVESGLMMTQEFLNSEAEAFENRISSAPTIEREFLTIAREQEIQSALYLMLLQMREENALTLAATVNNATIFDHAYSSRKPVAPSKIMTLLIALIFGFLIPLAVIYIKDLFKFNVEGSDDVVALTSAPLIGIIPAIKRMPSADNSIVIAADSSDFASEALRSLRANILLSKEHDTKVILVTSTSHGEGKSFIAANLAASLAFTEKRVVVVALDIRKYGLESVMGSIHKTIGLTSYLSGDSDDLTSLISKCKVSQNLDVLYGGAIPSNPSELLLNGKLEQVIETLKSSYDYVILDTAPIGAVADTMLFSHMADLSICVVRANVTPKRSFETINAMINDDRLPNVKCVIVGVEA